MLATSQVTHFSTHYRRSDRMGAGILVLGTNSQRMYRYDLALSLTT